MVAIVNNRAFKKLKVVVFEGLDKSGKNTQSEMAKEYLISKGFKVYKLEYPDYESKWGKLIRAMLQGELPFDDEKFEEYQTNDKLKDLQLIHELEEQGYEYLVIDRYVTTQVVYAKTKNNPKIQKWIDRIIEELPKPTIEIFLDVQVATSIARRGQHGSNDKYESDTAYLEGVRKTYIDTLLCQDNSVILSNIDNKSKLDIFSKVLEVLNERGVI